LNDFVLGISGINYTIVIPDIPSTTLTIPGLSGLRGLFEDTLGELADTADAVSALLRLRFIPSQLSQAAADVRGLVDYLEGVGAAIAPAVQVLFLTCAVWLVVVYCIALYFGLRTGWRMLTGR
jgi:Ca2+/H+ antiporter